MSKTEESRKLQISQQGNYYISMVLLSSPIPSLICNMSNGQGSVDLSSLGPYLSLWPEYANKIGNTFCPNGKSALQNVSGPRT